MKAPRVLFISKEGMATFFFLLAAGAVIWSAITVLRQSITAGLRPQYIIMTNPDVLLMAPEQDPEKTKALDLEQTRLVMDSIFNKSPSGLDAPERCKNLLSDEAWTWVRSELVDKQSEAFHDGHMHQKVEIEKIELRKVAAVDDSTIASVQGQLIRTGISGNRLFNEVWNVRAEMVWVHNPSLRMSGRQPTICDRFQCRETPVASTIRRTSSEDSITPPKVDPSPAPQGTTAAAEGASN